MTPRAYLDAVRRRCEAATAGPWQVWDGPSYVGGGRDLCIGAGEKWIANVDERRCDVLDKSKAHGDEHDAPDICPICSLSEEDITTEQTATAAFIASARTDIPKLERIARLAEDYREAVRKGNIESISADETRCALFAALEELK